MPRSPYHLDPGGHWDVPEEPGDTPHAPRPDASDDWDIHLNLVGVGVHPPQPRQRDLWEIEAEPLPEPLAHQFRSSIEGWRCEADFQALTLSLVREDDLLLSEEPVLFDLSEGPDGRLRMRLNDESRQVMVANIESRLSDPNRDAGVDRQDRAKIARLHAGNWAGLPSDFALAIDERYAAFVRTRAT